MYNMNRKLRIIRENYMEILPDLEECLKEAITSDKDINIVIGFNSLFKPVVFNEDINNPYTDYYDDIIYTVRNNSLCLMDWFDNDINIISEILGVTYNNMKEYASKLFDKPVEDIDLEDVLIAIDTATVNEKLLKERKRIILETYDFRVMAKNILDTYWDFLKINYKEVD